MFKMVIYADKNADMMNGVPMTPHSVYQSITDFSVILDAISNGTIPSGTGRPFPVNYDLQKDGSNFSDNIPPWA